MNNNDKVKRITDRIFNEIPFFKDSQKYMNNLYFNVAAIVDSELRTAVIKGYYPFSLMRAFQGDTVVTIEGKPVTFIGYNKNGGLFNKVIARVEGKRFNNTYAEDGRHSQYPYPDDLRMMTEE